MNVLAVRAVGSSSLFKDREVSKVYIRYSARLLLRSMLEVRIYGAPEAN